MKKITLFFIFLTCSLSNAQFNLSTHTVMENTNTTEGSEFIQYADMDGDGDKDILSADIYNVKWFENTDGLNTQIVSHIVTNFGGNFCAPVDVDGDGDQDVVVQAGQYGNLYWSQNNDGRGNFNAPVQLFPGSSSNPIYGVSIVDFDFDNDWDILVSGNFGTNSSLRFVQNTNGQGNFTASVIPKDFTNSRAIYAADIDRDNDIDIFSFNYNTQKLECLVNNGGVVSFTTRVITDAKNNGFATINLADIDNDTDLDLIVTNSDVYTTSIEEIKILKNDGAGNLVQSQVLVTTGIDISSIATKDLDNDNDLDIVFSSVDNDKVGWFKNTNGQGNYSTMLTITSTLNGAKSVTAYDFDGDSDIDVVSASQTEDKIVWYENTNGLASFGPEKILTRSINRPLSSIYRDIDGDGDLDVVSASDNDGKVAWYKNVDGQGTFAPQTIISADLYSARVVEAVDLDQDGDLDIVSGESHSTQSKFVWYKNLNGQGQFSSEINVGSGYMSGLSDLKAADLDNDGDNDLVYLTQWVESTIIWLENNGQGSFISHVITLTNNSTAAELLIADMNNDGKKDIVLPGFKLTWYANNGAGSFTEVMIDGSFYDSFSCKVADMDGDGDNDLVGFQQRNFNGNYSVGWYENLDGRGNFSTYRSIYSVIGYGGYSEEVHLGDMDSDGDKDILSGRGSDGTLGWFENLDGQANFTTKRNLLSQSGYEIASVSLDDVNQDGYIDILASLIHTNYQSPINTDKIVYYKNSGPAYNKINGFVRAGINLADCNLPADNMKVTTSNGTDTFETFTTKSGYYQFYVDPGTYTTSLATTLGYFNVSAPATYTSNFSGIGNIDVANFCLQPSQIIKDLNVVLLPVGEARPGFDSQYQIVYRNVGTTRLSGTVTLNFDDTKLAFESASTTPTSETTNALTFDYVDLDPFETRTVNLIFQIAAPPTTDINDHLLFTTAITPDQTDYSAADNLHVLDQIVIGSFDPNDITCLEGDEILMEQADDYLHYVIRFQNTGTASAINVRIENILNDKLDWDTFQLLNASHTNRVEIKNGNRVSFIFNNIFLPDSNSNEPASHGFVAYKIKAKNTVDVGDLIANQASIYFDFNLPIVTNEALTEIVEENPVDPGEEEPAATVSLHPMPVTDFLTITSSIAITKVEIYNTLGQRVLISNQNSINLSNLTTGMYFCKVTDKNNHTITKSIMKN